MEPLARCEPMDYVTFSWPAEESGCVLLRGEGRSGSHPHLSALICLRAGGCLSLVRLGEWMPSSASGGNDQSFISFLQCQSLQPSILEVCNSSVFSSCWPRKRGGGQATAAPASCHDCLWFFSFCCCCLFAFLAVWGKKLGLGD